MGWVWAEPVYPDADIIIIIIIIIITIIINGLEGLDIAVVVINMI